MILLVEKVFAFIIYQYFGLVAILLFIDFEFGLLLIVIITIIIIATNSAIIFITAIIIITTIVVITKILIIIIASHFRFLFIILTID